MLALACRLLILQAIGLGVLDTTPVVGVPNALSLRVSARVARNLVNWTMQMLVGELRRLWAAARRRGASIIARPGYSVADCIQTVVSRTARVMRLVPPNDTRWAGRNGVTINVLDRFLQTAEVVVPRVNGTTGKTTDSYFASRGFRSDAKWVVDVKAIMFHLAMRCGCRVIQAEYIAAATALDYLGVSCGLQPGHVIPGNAPEDFGVRVPTTLPTTYVYVP